MKVLVDVTTWTSGRSGVGLYTERLLRAMAGLGHDDELLLASNGDMAEIDLVGRRLGPTMPVRALWMQTAMVAHGLKQRPDIAFYPNYMAPLLRTCPTVVTVHDLAVFVYPETFTFKKRVLQRALLPTIMRRADAILTPSESTRRDILDRVEVDPAKVVAIHLAADPAFHQPIDDDEAKRLKEKLHLPDRYLLAVGTLEPRKNLVRLISAFEHVYDQDPSIRLLLVGGKGWRDAAIRAVLESSSAAAAIDAVGYVDFLTLRVLYSNALALCYPSLYEGFGLPVVEAMASGTPVMVSRGSSLDEVAQDAALTVDALRVDEIAEGLLRLVSDAELRARLRQRGLQRAGSLSWHKTAQRTREVFERVVQGQAPNAQ
jgi:glycosyltransferase involved in cell wall biosynthesis